MITRPIIITTTVILAALAAASCAGPAARPMLAADRAAITTLCRDAGAAIGRLSIVRLYPEAAGRFKVARDLATTLCRDDTALDPSVRTVALATVLLRLINLEGVEL